MLSRGPSLGADELILDLEDAVAVGAKDRARGLVIEHLIAQGCGGQAASVRVNAPRTPWCHRDVVELASLETGPAAIVVPKVESAGDLAFVDRLLDGAEAAAGRPRPLRIQALIETAAGLARVHEIAAASPRLDSLILGYADLAASLGRAERLAAVPEAWRPAQDAVLTAARAHGLQAIDGPHLGLAADERFAAAVVHARDLGFDGKWALHPAQVGPLNHAFAPTDAELASARAVIAALDDATRSGVGAVAMDGQMLDEAVRVAAARVLARAGEDDERSSR